MPFPTMLGWGRIRAAALLCLALALAACGEKASTSGVVKDNFGKPVVGAVVSVDGKAASATTDAAGRFEIAYKAGRFNATIEHPGYTSGAYTMRVAAEEGRTPVEAVLQRLPERPGVYAVAADGYVPLNPCRFGAFANLEPPGNWYLVEHGIPTRLPDASGAPLTLLDYGRPPGEIPSAVTEITQEAEFFRTQPPTNRDPVIYREPPTTELTQTFPSSGRWFQVTPSEAGVYVYTDRVKEAATGYFLPDLLGTCAIFAVGTPGATWLSDKISEQTYQAFLAAVAKCWPTPPEGPDRQQIVSLRVTLNPDGRIANPPAQLRRPLDTFRQRPAYTTAINMAASAVTSCQPYTMFAGLDPALWHELVVTFDLPLLFAR